MPHREAALTLVEATRHVPPEPRTYALREVLDRLGPSVFAGLLDADGVLRYANQAALQAIGAHAGAGAWPALRDNPLVAGLRAVATAYEARR